MRIGIVSPYSFDTPGGVQNHVRDLAETLISLGHYVNVLAPANDDEPLPRLRDPGRAGGTGAVQRLGGPADLRPDLGHPGPALAATNRFDVIHVHEPVTPSLSMLAVLSTRLPVVATFHTAMTRSRAMAAAQGLLQLVLEKITARIAVSALARRVQVEHLDGGAWEIPNGVAVAKFATAEPMPGWPGPGGAIGFLGRFTEDRKGFPILADAFARTRTRTARSAPADRRSGRRRGVGRADRSERSATG